VLAAVLEYLPLEHLVQASDGSPSTSENVPAGHERHALADVAFMYFPFKQREQFNWPSIPENLPDGHDVQF
jgi:hypothetical protein